MSEDSTPQTTVVSFAAMRSKLRHTPAEKIDEAVFNAIAAPERLALWLPHDVTERGGASRRMKQMFIDKPLLDRLGLDWNGFIASVGRIFAHVPCAQGTLADHFAAVKFEAAGNVNLLRISIPQFNALQTFIRTLESETHKPR